MRSPDPRQIELARERIDSVFLDSPLRQSAKLNRRFEANLFIKDETANPIRSFKGRGACNLVRQLKDKRHIVTASAGNFGQGMAWAARREHRHLTVFASTNAVSSKVQAMEQLGAAVVLSGADFDEAKLAAAAYADERKALWIEDGALAPIAEGAGTIALEAFEQAGGIDCLLTPLGNGALAAGLGSWVKYKSPSSSVVAVASTGAPAMAKSVKEGIIHTTRSAETIADGIAVRVPIPAAVDAVREVVQDVMLVDDDQIRTAMNLLNQELALVSEPAGAVGFAALVADPARWRGQTIVIPVCGGNI